MMAIILVCVIINTLLICKVWSQSKALKQQEGKYVTIISVAMIACHCALGKRTCPQVLRYELSMVYHCRVNACMVFVIPYQCAVQWQVCTSVLFIIAMHVFRNLAATQMFCSLQILPIHHTPQEVQTSPRGLLQRMLSTLEQHPAIRITWAWILTRWIRQTSHSTWIYNNCYNVLRSYRSLEKLSCVTSQLATQLSSQQLKIMQEALIVAVTINFYLQLGLLANQLLQMADNGDKDH